MQIVCVRLRVWGPPANVAHISHDQRAGRRPAPANHQDWQWLAVLPKRGKPARQKSRERGVVARKQGQGYLGAGGHSFDCAGGERLVPGQSVRKCALVPLSERTGTAAALALFQRPLVSTVDVVVVKSGGCMLHWAAVFLVIALIAALFGFGGIAAGAAGIAKVLFVLFIILALVAFVVGRRAPV